jgi:hypothetical protein
MNAPSVATKAELATIDPINLEEPFDVFVEEEGKTYRFEYTSTAEPDGESVIACGCHASDHPTHADQVFMAGRWVVR